MDRQAQIVGLTADDEIERIDGRAELRFVGRPAVVLDEILPIATEELEDIVPRVAVEDVIALAACQRIIATAAARCVSRATANHHVGRPVILLK